MGPADDDTLVGDAVEPTSDGALFAGRYVIECELGRGGMGTVHAAFDRTLGERVALKVLHETPAGKRGEAVERFLREVRLARRVTHPNVARTHDVGDADGLHYLTMEYVEGRGLDAVLREDGALAAARVVALGRQIADGLAAAHAVGIAHRDLKPSNVLLETGGRVVLTDFGIARALEDDRALTQDGAGLVGTPAYMAPEQVAGESVDVPVDVFALGLVLYELLTARLPYAADSAIGLAVARLERDPAPLPEGTPSEIAALVMDCLKREPASRPTATEVSSRLTALASVDGSAWTSPTLPGASAGQRPTFHTVTPGEHGLAVLPFRYRGSPDDAYLSSALTEELIDILSMTRGLKIPAGAATARFLDERSPARVGEALDVQNIVDGTVQKSGDRVRISVRLIDVATGIQRWTERFDGRLEDVFELQDRMAKRVAETLRLKVESIRLERNAPPEAVELCLRARDKRRESLLGGAGPDGAMGLYEQALRIAPDFKPALAGYAICRVVTWFFPENAQDRDWAGLAKAAVDDALAKAPELVDTHIAAARYHVQLGDYTEAAAALATALRIAPTSADAHEYLAALQCEAGRVEEGIRRAAVVAELDPTRVAARLAISKIEALRGRWRASEETHQQILAARPDYMLATTLSRLRSAVWQGDADALGRHVETLRQVPGSQAGLVARFAELFDDPTAFESAEETFMPLAAGASPRFIAFAYQLLTEGASIHAGPEVALRFLGKSVDAGLVDLEWIDRCTALDALRGHAEFNAARKTVAQRAEAIWALE